MCNERREIAEKHKGGKKELISRVGGCKPCNLAPWRRRPVVVLFFRVFPAGEKLEAVKLKIHLPRGLARRRAAVVREKLAGIYFLVKDPWRGIGVSRVCSARVPVTRYTIHFVLVTTGSTKKMLMKSSVVAQSIFLVEDSRGFRLLYFVWWQKSFMNFFACAVN